jgi:hypothetical protein
MDWQGWIILGFFILASVCVIIQTVRVFLWKDKYVSLVKTLRLGEGNGKAEESSRGTEERSS